MTHPLDQLADQLVAGHDGGPLILDVPETLVPADMEAVYGLQDRVIARLGAVGGWKVAAGTGPDPVCAPIPANRYFADGASLDAERHRFVLAEVEVAIKLGRDLPAGASPTAVEGAVGSIHPALELVGSPFVDRSTMPRNLLLGDLQSNGAVIVGPALDNAVRNSLATLAVGLDHDGREVHAVARGASWDDTLAALAWLAGHAATRNLPLMAGQVIITGARALFALDGAKSVTGRMEGFGSVGCRL